MRATSVALFVVLAVGLAGAFGGDGGKPEPRVNLPKTAQAFVNAYRAKNVDEMMKLADTPFLVGPVENAKRIERKENLLAEFKRQLADEKAVEKFPTKALKVFPFSSGVALGNLSEVVVGPTNGPCTPPIRSSAHRG